jgi:hypothetical protein
MLKLSGVIKTTPFEFTDLDGSVHKLVISAFTVGDMKKLYEMQAPIIGDNCKLPVQEQNMIAIGSRIVCAVKVAKSLKPFWKTTDEFAAKDYPNGLFDALHEAVNDLNPLSTETLEEKKNQS